MPANYTYATFTEAEAALASRLFESYGDATQQFWDVGGGELQVYLIEALRTWNALTSFWRSEFAFTLSPGGGVSGSQWWYDITQLPNSNRPFTVTDTSILQSIQYSLLEPLSNSYPLTWTGSKQFNIASILDAMTRRQNQVLAKTGCTISVNSIAAQLVTRTVLPDTAIDIRRVAWLPKPGFGYVNTIMKQSDLWAKRSFDPGWTIAEAEPPSNWMQSAEPPPAFDSDRIPPVPGTYDVLTVNSGPTVEVDAPSILTIPDDWSWIVKWGALAGLLSRESEASDPARAAYAQQRFDLGCQVLMNSPAVLALQLNGYPLFVDPVRDGDDFNPSWQTAAGAEPGSCYAAGLNLIAFPAVDVPYGALISTVQNAPVPPSGGSFVQVARGDYDTILDEAQHLAMFKAGGAEFAKTSGLHQRFIEQAGIYNKKLAAMGQFQMPMYGISGYEGRRDPRM